jgi:hypothetical protein
MNRPFFIFLISLAALCGSLVAAWATHAQQTEALRGYVDATQTADLPYRLPLLGVNAELRQYTPAELTEQMVLMRRAQITWVRQFVDWNTIETARGAFDWSAFDPIMSAAAAESDLRLVLVLMNTPPWARRDPQSADPTTPPDDPADFAAFAAAVAARYGAAVDHYQIWDEPNLREAWGMTEPRPADYAALLQASYHAIHAADPDATVIAAALAPTTEQGPANISDWRFLRDLYALGAADFMDAAAGKPYGFDSSPDDRQVREDALTFARMIGLREEMTRAGDGRTALWASNWGWNSLPTDWTGAPSIWGSVSEDERIAYTLRALERAEREWTWLGGMILHHWQPAAPPDDPVWGFALIDQNDAPTPLLTALIEREQADSARDGLHAVTTPYASYSGVWTFGELGADIGWVDDSQLAFAFAGTDVALLLREDNYVAYLYPTIDGQPANATPRDADGNAYIVLTSDSQQPELNIVPVARALSNGEHTLRLITDKGFDRWALAGFAVSSGDLTEPYRRQIIIGLLAAVVAAVAAGVSGWQVRWREIFQPLLPLWSRLGAAGQMGISALTSLALLGGMLLTWGDAAPNLLRREPVQLFVSILTAGVIYLQPGLILTLIAALVLVIIIYNRLDLGLMLVIFYAPFFLFPVELYQRAFPMAELLMLITAGAWLLRSLAAWGRARQSSVSQFPAKPIWSGWQPLDYAVLAWAGLGLLALSWSDIRTTALTELRTLFIEPALFYVVFRTAGLDVRDRLRLIDALLLAGLLVAGIGLAQFVMGEGIITAEEGTRRLASVYGSPNNVGLFLGRCIPFALAFLVIAVDRRRRIAAGVVLLVMLLAALLSQSAGALFIGIPAAVAAVLLLAWGRRALLPLAGLAGIGGLGFVVALQSARFARLLDFTQGTNFYRIRVWQSAVNVIRDHPLTGLGLDQFLYAFRGHYIYPDAWQEPNLSHPHNVILDFWVRLGILGVILFVWMQVAFWRAILPLYRFYRQHDRVTFALIIGTMGCMVNLLAHGLVDNSVYVQDLSYVFVLLLGLASTQIEHESY